LIVFTQFDAERAGNKAEGRMKESATPWRGAVSSYILFLTLLPLLPTGGLSHNQTNRATVVYPELILPSDTFFQPSTSFLPNKLVFAHYMLCWGAFDWDPTLADAAIQDIQMAQAMGIDGFAQPECLRFGLPDTCGGYVSGSPPTQHRLSFILFGRHVLLLPAANMLACCPPMAIIPIISK